MCSGYILSYSPSIALKRTQGHHAKSPSVSCRTESTQAECNSHSYNMSLSNISPACIGGPYPRGGQYGGLQMRFSYFPTFVMKAQIWRSSADAQTLEDCVPESFSILFSFWRSVSITSSSSSSPTTSDSSNNRPGTGPGTMGSSSPELEFDDCLGLSALMKAPTARLTACAKQLVEKIRTELYKSWVNWFYSLWMLGSPIELNSILHLENFSKDSTCLIICWEIIRCEVL